jgi:23S rRNA pseudouridine1911/1915/1917 synthase
VSHRFIVPEEAAGQRFDRWLCLCLPQLSRSRIQRLIRQGHATLNGQPAKPSTPLTPGARVEVHVPAEPPIPLEPEPMPLSILYEDEDLVVVDKPSGRVVYPGAGNRRSTLLQGLLHGRTLARIGAPERPGVVHRLDKETSGVILFAKSDSAYYSLIRQFKDRTVQKTYLALVHGRVEQDEGRIEAPLGRDVQNRQRRAIRKRGGRPAVTEFRVLQRHDDATLLQVSPLTGRTHQIRVHLTAIGHPVVGDPLYGRKNRKESTQRLMLHAWKLAITHPRSGRVLEFIAPVPAEFGLPLWPRAET